MYLSRRRVKWNVYFLKEKEGKKEKDTLGSITAALRTNCCIESPLGAEKRSSLLHKIGPFFPQIRSVETDQFDVRHKDSIVGQFATIDTVSERRRRMRFYSPAWQRIDTAILLHTRIFAN